MVSRLSSHFINQCMLTKRNLCCLTAEHKAASGCTGKRDRTQYVRLPDFTERQLISDYRLLEETQLAQVPPFPIIHVSS